MPEEPKKQDSKGRDFLLNIAMILFFGFIYTAGQSGYEWLDTSGYLPHTATVDLFFKGEWLNGENRDCEGVQDRTNGKGKPSIKYLYCPADVLNESEKPHNLAIRFWGKTSRPELFYASLLNFRPMTWRCTRNDTGFTCYATG